MAQTLPETSTRIRTEEEHLLEAMMRLVQDDSLSLGRLDFLRARICGERDYPTSTELAEQFLVLPSNRPGGPVLSPATAYDQRRLERFVFREPWTAVTVAMPAPGHHLHPLFERVCETLLSEPFPLPVVRTRHKKAAAAGISGYLSTVLPRPWAELLIDCGLDGNLVDLNTPRQVEFSDLFRRRITEAEFVLSLPADFEAQHLPQVCRLLPHLLASLMVAGRTGLPMPRVVPAQQRARQGWTQDAAKSLEYWGGAATIAMSPTAISRLLTDLPPDPRYAGLDPVSRVIDLMSAVRIDPEPTTSASDWLIYQARWGYFFPGYWRGITMGFDLLARYGAVASGIFMTQSPGSVYSLAVDDGRLVKEQVPLDRKHSMLAEYLSEQRMWMSAYDMSPLAPNSTDLARILETLPLGCGQSATEAS